MKYVKAHKETLRPFKEVGEGEKGEEGQEARKTPPVSIFRRETQGKKRGKTRTSSRYSQYALAGTSKERHGEEKEEVEGEKQGCKKGSGGKE